MSDAVIEAMLAAHFDQLYQLARDGDPVAVALFKGELTPREAENASNRKKESVHT